MRILLIGGTGVIGEGVIPVLLLEGHQVRLLSREADRDARQWPENVVSFSADVGSPEQLTGAADGADAVVHITGIVEEKPPEITFEKVNVEGTRNVLREAERAGVRRFIYISSLGAERGASEYHRSKKRAEDLVREFPGEWLILRPGNVYGPGDEVISTLMTMIRTFPTIPVIDSGEQRFQPIWYRDLGEAIARAVATEGLSHRTLELAGKEITSMNDILDRLTTITGRDPVRIPIPSYVASLGTQIAGMFGVSLPLNESKLEMLLEENVIEPSTENALLSIFQVDPIPLDAGLRILADAAPEQTPEEGFGDLERKSFRADIEGSQLTPAELMTTFRRKCTEIMPIEFQAEPDTPQEVEQGITLTAALPLRGNIQMRVEEVTETSVTFGTLKGHPLAGVVRFSAEEVEGNLRFTITIYARAANIADWVAMKTVGSTMQDLNWQTVVTRVVELSGGKAPRGVESETESLEDGKAREVEEWIAELVTSRKREENAGLGG
jgi:NADH dehydrogenase